MKNTQPFDYAAAVAELERIAQTVEDPSTGIDDIDKALARTKELVEGCRAYLRSARAQTESL
ncbi:MAG: exodeoxyribonuclease VII small subunit [Bacteroidales bacterium]|nr:exodeoxyribonuclease VII small subunit [Bacteroidales bacterium]